jgi:hypothetical protein
MGKAKPKRPRKTPRREPFIWAEEETAALLVWLDQCVERGLDFKDTVVQWLKQKWPHRDYEYKTNVWNKLCWAKRTLGERELKVLDIISEGTKCLDLKYLTTGEKVAYDEATMGFSISTRRLRSRTKSNANSPRAERLQSSVRSPSITSSPMLEQAGSRVHLKVENESVCSRSPPVLKRAASVVRVLLSFDVNVFGYTKIERQQLSDAPAVKKFRLSPRRSSRLRTEIPESDDGDAQTDPRTSITALPDGHGDLTESIPDQNMGDNLSPAGDSTSLDEKDRCLSRAEARILNLQELLTERDTGISTLRQQNDTLSKSNNRLCNLVSQLSREIKDCKTCLKERENCWKAANRYPEVELKMAIKENEETITYLKEQLYKCQKIAKLKPSIHISPELIDGAKGYIEDQVKGLFYTSNMTFPDLPVDFGLKPERESFLRRSFAFLLGSAPIEQQIVEFAKEMGVRNVLRVLAAAVLREWIFESDFHNFDDERSQLLAMYRKILIAQKGS